VAAPEEKRQETFLSCPLRTVGGLYSCIELTDWPDVAHVERMGMAELKTAEDWPVLWLM